MKKFEWKLVVEIGSMKAFKKYLKRAGFDDVEEFLDTFIEYLEDEMNEDVHRYLTINEKEEANINIKNKEWKEIKNAKQN